MQKQYDYIITGGGCAGLSLLLRMMRDPFFRDKNILVIDRAPKTENDRTWCFWEKENGLFEPIVYHRWQYVHFYSAFFSDELNLSPYQYKMIRGIDFYEYVMQEAVTHANITFQYDDVLSVEDNGDTASAVLRHGAFTAGYVFNSIPFKAPKQSAGTYQLLQHFKGWVIQTKENCFDAQIATLMDFRITQDKGTAFVYVMPTTANTALVEYTLFTETVLPQELYEAGLRDYIEHRLLISEYTVSHEEFGVIPMTNARFAQTQRRLIQMGTAGGAIKASTGYAFQHIQKKADQLVKMLAAGKKIDASAGFADRKGHFYDSVLLQVLSRGKMNGDKIFASIFRKNKTADVLRFLDNESDMFTDLGIMQSVPVSVFLPAALKQLFV